MNRAGRIATATAVILFGALAGIPIVANFVKDKKEDEALKEPTKQEVVLLESAKTTEQLGVKNVYTRMSGTTSLVLEECRIKFEAGCGADGFVMNVRGVGSVELDYETKTVYTEDARYELYTLKGKNLVPRICFAGETELTIDIYAHTCGRLYKIETTKYTVAGWDALYDDSGSL